MNDPALPRCSGNRTPSGAPPARTIIRLVAMAWTLAWSVAPASGGAGNTALRDTSPLPYRAASWDPEGLGHHRVVLEVAAPARAVFAHIPWRRRDAHPEKETLVVTDASGRKITNLKRLAIGRESGDLVFDPVAGPGTYYVYYRPYRTDGNKHYPTVTYPPPRETAAGEWLAALGSLDPVRLDTALPHAKVVAIESSSEFDSVWPMEVIATRTETKELRARYAEASYLVFPEDRRFPIRMRHDLPQRWVERAAAQADGARSQSVWPLSGTARRGEFYAFQLGLWAIEKVHDIRLRFTDLVDEESGARIPLDASRCFNLGGIGPDGLPFVKQLDVEAGAIQPLWCGVQVPPDARPGSYRGMIDVAPSEGPPTTVPVTIEVEESVIEDAGDNEPWRHSRLRWLDSRIGFDNDIVAPYEPVSVDGDTLTVLGRRITLGPSGLPARIESFFSPEMTKFSPEGRQILARPIAFVVQDAQGQPLAWRADGVTITGRERGSVAWSAHNVAGPLAMDLSARLEFDGNIDFQVALSATAPLDVDDIRLEIPYTRDTARYMLGMGRKGGRCPEQFDWRWDVTRNQEGAWIGDVNAGLQFALRDANYQRPLNTNFYQKQPLVLPESWDNDGKGGCRLQAIDEREYRVACTSGPRALRPSTTLHFDLRLAVTPFKPIDTAKQWHTRFYHAYESPEEIAAAGANTINIHHATPINPYINYPFLRTAELSHYVRRAHDLGMKVKIYNTIRELSNHAPEIFALFSLGGEIFSSGPGGGPPWLQEHLESGYIPGWFVPDLRDAAVINAGVSRWHNYYLSGIDWVARHTGIDGLYIDDIAFDRLTMQRLRKILDHDRPGALIDLHSANQFNERDGYINSALLYMEHFPYLDRLWFGEYFDYDSDPDYWLTEISGIPFGLMGEMLQDGGNPWRGMIYGMTSRLPWAGDPRPLWRAWDDFGIEGSRMIGTWAPSCPVRTGRPDILATCYVRPDRTLVSLASWAEGPSSIRLAIDWQALGLDPARCRLTAPPIEAFQRARTFAPTDMIPMAPGRGWLLVLSEEPPAR